MSAQRSSELGICEIAGCTSPGVTSRWVVLPGGRERRIEVCWKHREGELSEAVGSPNDTDPDSTATN
jgi:hypothetical protein